jgi:epoxyqueuosine reductase
MLPSIDLHSLSQQIKRWAHELGFQHCGVSDCDLSEAEGHLHHWLQRQFHGEMDYMARHGRKRSRPAELHPGTLRILSLRMDYLPPAAPAQGILSDPQRGYISRYALGRDYHKLLRTRLQQLAQRIQQAIGTFSYRVFCDSAPVLEKAIAAKAGLGWIGKHSNLIQRRSGSWFFLGEIYTDLPLPADLPVSSHCGRCQACIDRCPTGAIVAPYQLDARRCISYLTIELHGPIPLELRARLGNRIYGCDDCQLACPWNRFARPTAEAAFLPRLGLDSSRLAELFLWSEQAFLQRLEGSPIRRIGHERWLRNIAVALGNAAPGPVEYHALQRRRQHPSLLVREHVQWALDQYKV